MENKDLAGKNLWDKKNHPNNKMGTDKAIIFDDLFKQLASEFENKDLIEIGAIPGNFCVFLNKNFGCHITGLDYGDKSIFEGTMQQYGINDYNFIKADFLNYESDKLYDIVSSYGFIEHFLDTEDILKRHFALIKIGGYLILTVPNFTRLQFLFHFLFDRDNLKNHNTGKPMDKKFMEKFMIENGLAIVFSQYSKSSKFWITDSGKKWRRPWELFAKLIGKILNTALSGVASKYTSTYLIIIAQKTA
jgi:2-polyprenyl-3-methyl-5-hydroxy-6-metoxy-1,4-benzoquinol methylase